MDSSIKKDKVFSMKRRCDWHDYSSSDLYMITLVVADRQPLLGNIEGNENDATVKLSRLGETILCDETKEIEKIYPMIEVWKACIMPDHIHIILNVKEDLPYGVHLGHVIRGFKSGCSKAWWRLIDKGLFPSVKTQGTQLNNTSIKDSNTLASKPHAQVIKNSVLAVSTARKSLFEPGYNDKIISHFGQLDNWKRYLDDNPRRLLIKRRNPQLFTILHNIEVAGKSCQMVGNRFLLDIPDKVAVIIHRRYTPQECERLKNEWLAIGEAGGVLVGTAVAPKEKEIMREALNRGYRIILLKENGFPPLYKPQGESFDACKRGQLLQISPWQYDSEHKKITREQCLQLNGMAEVIASQV